MSGKQNIHCPCCLPGALLGSLVDQWIQWSFCSSSPRVHTSLNSLEKLSQIARPALSQLRLGINTLKWEWSDGRVWSWGSDIQQGDVWRIWSRNKPNIKTNISEHMSKAIESPTLCPETRPTPFFMLLLLKLCVLSNTNSVVFIYFSFPLFSPFSLVKKKKNLSDHFAINVTVNVSLCCSETQTASCSPQDQSPDLLLSSTLLSIWFSIYPCHFATCIFSLLNILLHSGALRPLTLACS